MLFPHMLATSHISGQTINCGAEFTNLIGSSAILLINGRDMLPEQSITF